VLNLSKFLKGIKGQSDIKNNPVKNLQDAESRLSRIHDIAHKGVDITESEIQNILSPIRKQHEFVLVILHMVAGVLLFGFILHIWQTVSVLFFS